MKTSAVFPELEPPPHGWRRMRARMVAPRRPVRVLGLAFAAAALLLLVVLTRPGPTVDLMPEARASVVGGALGLDAPLESPVVARSEGLALLQLPSSNPSVVMFRFASLPAGERK